MLWDDMTIGSSHLEVFFKIGFGKVGKILSYDPNGRFIFFFIVIIYKKLVTQLIIKKKKRGDTK